MVDTITSRAGLAAAHAFMTCMVPTSSNSWAHSVAWVGCDRNAPWTTVSTSSRASRVAISPSIAGWVRSIGKNRALVAPAASKGGAFTSSTRILA